MHPVRERWDHGLRPLSFVRRRWEVGFGLALGFPRRGSIGVVKLLRARGGCLGVIRWWAWKAAKSSGELPHKR